MSAYRKCPRCEQLIEDSNRKICPICFAELETPHDSEEHEPMIGLAPPVAPAIPLTGYVPPEAGSLQAPAPILPPQAPAVPAKPAGLSSIGVRRVGEPLPTRVAPNSGWAAPTAAPVQAAPLAPINPPAPLNAPIAPQPLNAPIAAQPLAQASSLPPLSPPANAPRPTPPRPNFAAPAPSAPARSNGGVMALIVVLVLALGGGGAFWFMKNGGNPKDPAQKFVEAQIAGNYRAQYELMTLGAEAKKRIPNADAYEKQMQAEMPEQLKSILKSAKLLSVGEPKIEGDTAKVPVDVSITVLGQTQSMKQDVPMKKVEGKWKVDLDPNAITDALKGTKAGQ